MSDVERLLRDYIEEHRAGGAADPRAYLDQVEGTDRRELEALIDAYLARAPRRAWSAEAYEASGEPQLVESLSRSLEGASGLWPSLLPSLRERAQLRRRDLVERLAAALGAGDREEKVGAYYHQMEQGLLPARGVAGRVLEALGEIVGESAETLRRAGEALEPGGGQTAGAAAFARFASPDPQAQEAPAMPASPGPTGPAAETEWDELDELFRGG